MSETIIEGEVWKAIPGFERDYSVSNLGRISSRPRWGTSGGILKPSKTAKGYLRVELGCKPKQVHRLVAQSFIPNPDNNPEVNHKNGIKTDNAVQNLEWSTTKENVIHSFEVLGRVNPKGEQQHSAKLRADQINDIRWLLSIGLKSHTAAPIFGVHMAAVWYIWRGLHWKHVPSNQPQLLESNPCL